MGFALLTTPSIPLFNLIILSLCTPLLKKLKKTNLKSFKISILIPTYTSIFFFSLFIFKFLIDIIDYNILYGVIDPVIQTLFILGLFLLFPLSGISILLAIIALAKIKDKKLGFLNLFLSLIINILYLLFSILFLKLSTILIV
jgi:hypothetical protein